MNSIALFALGAGIGLVVAVVIVAAYVGAAAVFAQQSGEMVRPS